jgi:hypothetical protein
MNSAAPTIILWVIPGYIGAGWLIAKGYLGELTGCAVAAGGMMILFPAVLGLILLLAAVLLPAKGVKVQAGPQIGELTHVNTGDITNYGGAVEVGKIQKVITNLNSSERTELRELGTGLDILGRAIVDSLVLTPHQKQEHLDVIAQVAAEAAKDHPNKTVL